MKNRFSERQAVDGVLAKAIRAVSRDDAETEVPAHLETLVMQAWDARTGANVETPNRAASRRRLLFAGLAASVMLSSAAVWMVKRGATDDSTNVATGVAGYYGAEVATVDVVLDDDPASLQVVKLSIEPSVLTTFGYPVPDLVEGGPVEIEVLVGLDGVPRAIRNPNWRPSGRSDQ